jgi:methylenetetrahydrofolate reductase (NADPH)
MIAPFEQNPGSPLPQKEGHVSRGRFERVLRSGKFAVTAELAPPDSASADDVYQRAQLFDGYVDGPTARARIAICPASPCARC